MTSDNIILEIVTPEGLVCKENISGINVPTGMGRMGILNNHAPMMSDLQIGVLEYTKNDKKYRVAISAGFLEVSNNLIKVLVHTGERAEDIDIRRAEAAAQRANERLNKRHSGLDEARALAALRRSMARLHAADRGKGLL